MLGIRVGGRNIIHLFKYSTAIDETPILEQKCKELDVGVRYFSNKAQRIVVEQLQSYQLGFATAEI